MTDTRPDLIPGPTAPDDPGGLQTGQFGLNGDLKTAIADALTDAGWNPDDDAATAEGDDQPTAPDIAPPSDVEGAGAGGEPTDGAAPDVDAPPGPRQPDADFDANAYWTDYFGTRLTRAQAEEFAATLNGLNNLQPWQRQELDRILAGGQPNQYPATTGQPMPAQQPYSEQYAPQPQQQAPDPITQAIGPRPDDEYAAQQWDLTARAMQVQQQQLDEVRAGVEHNTQVQLQQQQAQYTAEVTAGTDEWRAQYPMLSDGEFDALINRAVQSGIFPALQHQLGSIRAAATQTLEQTFWADPRLRQRAMANIASGRAPGDPATQPADSQVAQDAATSDDTRKARAASVAGGGGNAVPKGTSPQQVPTTKEGRQDAMLADLRAGWTDRDQQDAAGKTRDQVLGR